MEGLDDDNLEGATLLATAVDGTGVDGLVEPPWIDDLVEPPAIPCGQKSNPMQM